jgi:hypothetical protein
MHGVDPNPSGQVADEAPVLWHLCWQAAIGREFSEPSLAARIRWRLIDAHRQPGRVLLDYTVLPSEIHVVSRLPPGQPPGRLARAIGTVVARWVRDAHPVRSPVFAGPFRAHQIQSLAELREEVRMLAWRPVVLGLCARPAHHAQGGLRISLGQTPARGFDARPVLGLFGETVPSARAGLRSWVSGRPAEREWRAWALARGLVLASGGIGGQPGTAREVRGAGAAGLVAAGGADGVEGALRLLETWVSARLDGMRTPDFCRASGAGSVRARALVACLAVEHQLCSAAAVARHFGRAKATLSEQMKLSRARPADRQIVAMPVGRIIDEALALISKFGIPSSAGVAGMRT